MRTVAPEGGVRARVDRLRAIKSEGKVTRALMQARCDRGAEIALMLGFDRETAEGIRALDEHWDGGGQPRGLRGEEIPLLAADPLPGPDRRDLPRRRRPAGGVRRGRGGAAGEWFDPALVDALAPVCADAGFWDALHDDDLGTWEPGERHIAVDDDRLDRIADAFAGIIDAKSPWTYRHSDRACLIVMGVAAALGAGDPLLRDLRRAALLHDIGKLAVSNRILDKPARLTRAEYARIREHPLITERILARVPGCEHLAGMASAHHERLDGGGYPYGLADGELTMPMRVLAIADVYEALTSDRPYRRALTSAEALAVMRSDVPGRLDRESFATLERLLADDAGLRSGSPTGGFKTPPLGVMRWRAWTDSRISRTSARRSSACSPGWA